MSTLLDEETVILEGLDFEPVCDCITAGDKCGEEATHALFCASCGIGVGFACIGHAIWVRRTERTGTHVVCGFGGLIRDLVKVVPL